MDNPDDSIKDYDRILKSHPKEVFALTNRGFCWVEKVELRKASDDFKNSLEIDPQNCLALAGKAWCLIMTGHFEEAIQLFNQALEIMPNLTVALRGRGYAYKNTGQNAAARVDLLKALKLMDASHTPMAKKKRDEIGSWLKEMDSEVTAKPASAATGDEIKPKKDSGVTSSLL